MRPCFWMYALQRQPLALQAPRGMPVMSSSPTPLNVGSWLARIARSVRRVQSASTRASLYASSRIWSRGANSSALHRRAAASEPRSSDMSARAARR